MRRILLLALFISSSANAAGLLAPVDQTLPPLRITDHQVQVTIRDQVALTEISQTFHNDTNRRLEATYVFPLPEHADLTDFQMTFNGKLVGGEVLPADKAREIYESIVRRTKDPGLIEFIGRRLLQMRVFPIEPDRDTTIKLRYQQVTRPISAMHGYHYPLRTRKTAGQAYGMVRFSVALRTSAPLKNIWSPSHAVEIVREGDHAAKIAYEASGGSLEDDFLLLYDTDASDLGLSVIAHKPDASQPGHFVLMLSPKQLWPQTSYQPQDVVFVIDTSGSMAGEKIEQARRALQFCVDKLDERDRLNLVRFSTGFDVLFDGLAAATKENRARAQEFAESFSAAGGTNIADTLQHVLTMASAVGDAAGARPFVVVFLTDGQGNRAPDEILEALGRESKAAGSVRVFPFGVGHDVNTILLDRLANAFKGRPSYVQPGENLELVLGDFFSVVSQPVLTNLRLTLPGLDVTERFPATLGDLYHGQQLIIAARFKTPATGPVRLSATRSGEQVEYTWPDVAFVSTPEASYVPAVWAGRKISYLIDQIRAHGESQEMIAEIVSLSQQYGIQTPYTSWLVRPEQHMRLAGADGPWRQGLGQAIGRRGAQEGMLRSRVRSAPGMGVGSGGKRSSPTFGDSFGDIPLDEAERLVAAEAGEAANIIARKNAALKELRSRDEDRLDLSQLPIQKYGSRWYNRIGQFLVDAEVDEKTEIIIIRFGSEAYFDLVRGRADLRDVLAASRNAVVRVNATQALLVADEKGIERFSTGQREQFGLELR
ncbi:MAG: VIT domain-containing protein [Planctomycetota bacterium]|jgi:Ca-activated chloride channel family protein